MILAAPQLTENKKRTISKLAEFKQLEAQLAERISVLDRLKSSAKLKREIEFEPKLKTRSKRVQLRPKI